MAELSPGQVFAGYRIEGVLGEGGMATVYRARHLTLDSAVAVKVMAPGLSGDPAFRERFMREARAAAAIDHPNVLPVQHAGDEGGRLFVAMPIVEGGDLHARLARSGPFQVAEAIDVLDQVGAALDAAHAAGLVHRDVKAANVLLSDSGRAFLTDFGVARLRDAPAELTQTGQFIGTPDYIAPEQVEGAPATERSDVYSLGCLLFQMVTGRAVFADRETQQAKIAAHLGATPPSVREVWEGAPTELDPVIAKAMSKRPNDRQSTAGELARAARDAISDRRAGEPDTRLIDIRPTPPDDTPAPRRPSRRRALLWTGGGAVILGAATAGALVLGGGSGSGDDADPMPDTPAAVRTIPLGFEPQDIAVAPGGAWVSDFAGNAVTRVDPGTGDLQKFTGFSGPVGVFARSDRTWVANGRGGTVSRITSGSDGPGVESPIPTARNPRRVAVSADGALWVSYADEGVVRRYSAAGAQDPPDPISVGAEPRDLALGRGGVWVANRESGSVTRIALDDPATVETIPTGQASDPLGVAVGAGFVWVASAKTGHVARIDASTPGDPPTIVPVGTQPVAVGADSGSVFVADAAEDRVYRLDAETLEVDPPIDVGDRPTGIVVTNAAVWVANADGESLSVIER